MITIKGKGVSSGVAFGRISFFRRGDISVTRRKTDNTEHETERFENAKKLTIEQLRELYEKALHEVGEANAQIFDIHIMMTEDEDYNESVINIIKSQSVNAEYAVAVTSDNFAEMFSSMNDEYMKARESDVRDISNRIIKNMSEESASENIIDEGTIICSDDLTPSETVQLDKSKVIAFVTSGGSANSHTAILAGTMNIPAVTGAKELNESYDGAEAVVDGTAGIIYIEPSAAVIAEMKQKQEDIRRKKELLRELRGKENITKSGRKIEIYANISSIEEIGSVLLSDAGGIGLFRSEFLYLEEDDYPSEEKQFSVYKKALETMAGKKVIIRTLDIGADKKIDYFDLGEEENPALGFRAVRICLARKDIFKTQLRALYRASVYGNLSIMFPMITSVREIEEIREITESVKNELRSEGIPYSENIETGIMIETPAAAVISDRLAPMADFFSIGTNDLTQYTLAADRQNEKAEKYYDPHHEAVLRLIEMTISNAHKAGKWAGICGEIGGDEEMTERFLDMGADELSVSPHKVLEIREKVINCK